MVCSTLLANNIIITIIIIFSTIVIITIARAPAPLSNSHVTSL
jgi:hypothetical protein